jgi:predicted amidohydrolase
MQIQTVTRIGFFSFAEPYDKPCQSLDAARESCSEISGALIVLPEAFNYGRSYGDSFGKERTTPLLPADSVLVGLASRAEAWNCLFVVGVLKQCGSTFRNSAYVIRGHGRPLLIHYKTLSDATGTYEACAKDCDKDNPCIFGNAAIGVLICKEADVSDRVRLPYGCQLANSLSQTDSCKKLICIPACMSRDALFEGPRLSAPEWLGKYVILANSHPRGDSFITNAHGMKQESLPASNRLIFDTWDQLDHSHGHAGL